MSDEKLFVILEVRMVGDGALKRHHNHQYRPVDYKNDGHCDEELWLHPSRVIRESQLDYAKQIIKDEKFFSVSPRGSGWRDYNSGWQPGDMRLILKPPPEEEKSTIDRIMDNAPSCIRNDEYLRDWVRKDLIPYLKGDTE